jgi:hypothetical protein
MRLEPTGASNRTEECTRNEVIDGSMEEMMEVMFV